MTTRPQSVRMNHQRVRRSSVVVGLAGATWLVCGVAMVALTQSWWAWLFVAVGLFAAVGFFGLLPRLRNAKAQLQQVEQIRQDQERAAQAQLAARMQAFSQPPVRSPFASR